MQQSKSESAYGEIRSRVVEGTLQPGEPVSENALANLLGMSRTPVREAIRLLVRDGFLDSDGVSTCVHPFSVQELYDMIDVRTGLEEIALKTAIGKIPPDEIHRLQQLWGEMASLATGNGADRSRILSEILELDFVTHALLIRYCGNAVLRQLYENISLRVKWSQGFINSMMENDGDTIRLHQQFLECLLAGEGAAAAAAIRQHADDAVAHIQKGCHFAKARSLELPNWRGENGDTTPPVLTDPGFMTRRNP